MLSLLRGKVSKMTYEWIWNPDWWKVVTTDCAWRPIFKGVWRSSLAWFSMLMRWSTHLSSHRGIFDLVWTWNTYSLVGWYLGIICIFSEFWIIELFLGGCFHDWFEREIILWGSFGLGNSPLECLFHIISWNLLCSIHIWREFYPILGEFFHFEMLRLIFQGDR